MLRTLGLLLSLVSVQVLGHDSRPLYVEVEQLSEQSYLLAWKVPSSVTANHLPQLQLSHECEITSPSNAQVQRYQNQVMYRCGGDRVPRHLLIHYPQGNPSLSTIVRVQRVQRAVEVIHSPAGIKTITLQGANRPSDTILQYAQFGMRHIAGGYDHLLFVACLVLLAGSWRRILWAVTGFTLAHSVTLALATLDVWRLPLIPTEAVIALSILFLASEMWRENKQTLAWRYPILVASVFGLLHGFGFATVLNDIGLPEGEAFVALLAFNLGVEFGQLVFVAILLVCLAALARLRARSAELRRLVTYPIGTIASFWFWQRLVEFV